MAKSRIDSPAPKSGFRSSSAAGLAQPVSIQLRRKQRIVFDEQSEGVVFTIENGCLVLDADLAGNGTGMLLLLYPGDVIGRSLASNLANIGMTAVTAAVLTRRRLVDANSLQASTQSRLLVRSFLHNTAIGNLDVDERLATLLSEMALHLGREASGACTFELPLRRDEMAAYIALNPDTLSRAMSRLRSRGILLTPTRTRAIVTDLAALIELSPLAQALLNVRSSLGNASSLPPLKRV